MTEKVVITGIGIVSAIGMNIREVFASLVEGRAGTGPVTLFDTIHQNTFPVAEVKAGNDLLARNLGFSSADNFTRTSLLGMAAAAEAAEMAGILPDDGIPTGLISATTVGGMDRTEQFYKEFSQDPARGKLAGVIHHDCADSTDCIAGFLGIREFSTTVSTACSSSVNALIFGARLIRQGILPRVIVGGTDALTRFTLNGFNTLMILDREGCRPFDENRAGLIIGEGAAYLVLESERSAGKRKASPLAIVSGFGNANDAYHQTASSPEGDGAWMAMNKALEMSGLRPEKIGYINAHGTGTVNNDLSEGMAIQRLFGHQVPPFSSTKPFTGHTLGAAGSVESVITILALRHGIIFPNLNYLTPMKELCIEPATSQISGITLEHALSNSFGFGGNNSSVIFSRAD